MAGMAALKQLLSKGGDDGMQFLKQLGGKASDAGQKALGELDMALGKVPGMTSKYRADLPVEVGADPKRRNALLALLGLGGAGGAAYGMMDDED